MNKNYARQLKNLQEFYLILYLEEIEKLKLEIDALIFWRDYVPELSNVNRIHKFIMKNRIHFCMTDNDFLFVSEYVSRKVFSIYSLPNRLDCLVKK
jgi:hypothetical protein